MLIKKNLKSNIRHTQQSRILYNQEIIFLESTLFNLEFGWLSESLLELWAFMRKQMKIMKKFKIYPKARISISPTRSSKILLTFIYIIISQKKYFRYYLALRCVFIRFNSFICLHGVAYAIARLGIFCCVSRERKEKFLMLQNW